jgi:hypothetical protein
VGTRSNTPVFCDESGVRSVVVQWGGRGIGLLLLLLCAGLALTLQTRVEVPGLSRLLPIVDGSSELFHAPTRQPAREGGALVPNVGNQTGVRVRDLPLRTQSSVAPTVQPASERPAITWAHSPDTSSATSPSAAPTAQSSPTEKPSPTAGPAADPTPSPTAGPSARQRNPNAAVPRENPNAQGSAQAQAPGQLKAKGNGTGAPTPKAEVEPTTP